MRGIARFRMLAWIGAGGAVLACWALGTAATFLCVGAHRLGQLRVTEFADRTLDLDYVRSQDLRNANLEAAHLAGIDLSRRDLGGANLASAELQRANLRSACLWEAEFTNANLTGADLRGADLRAACLWGADLTGADLRGASVRGALYDSSTRWPQGFDPHWRAAKLQGRNLATDLGPYRPLLDAVLDQQGFSLSYLARDWPEVEQWRLLARGKLLELLAFTRRAAPLDARSERRITRDGVEIEEVSWEVGYGPRCQAWVLKPEGARGRLPAVLALHDHGGFKIYGKEKMVEADHAFPLTAEHRDHYYGGVAWPNALAKEGFLVLVHDAFAFGSRAVPVESISPRLQERFKDLRPGTPEYIRAYNNFAADHETILARSFLTAGTTWPGVFSYEDRRAVDYLVTRDDVDPERIGCGGLSGGGLRTVLLAGTDPRLKAACAVGFMTTWRDFLHDRVWTHTWMLYIPYCARYLDFPDILALNAPRPTLVQYDEEDPLYSLEGQRDADRRLRDTFKKMGAAERYTGTFYPGPHKFDVPMQAEAAAFFKRRLIE